MSRTPVNVLIRNTFRKPPILVGEDPADYQSLKEAVIEEVNPENLTHVLLARDIVDAQWEAFRLSGLKAGILHAMIPRAVNSLTDGVAHVNYKLAPDIRKHVVAMIGGRPQARQEFERMLAEHQLTLDDIVATAFVDAIGPQIQMDRMVAAACERRNAAYAELERLRAPSRLKERREELEYLKRENGQAGVGAQATALAVAQPTESAPNRPNGH